MPICIICKNEINEKDRERSLARPELSLPNLELCARPSCRREYYKRKLGKLNRNNLVDIHGNVTPKPKIKRQQSKIRRERKIIGYLYQAVTENNLQAYQDRLQRLQEHFNKHTYPSTEIHGILSHLSDVITTRMFKRELERMPPEFRKITPPPVIRKPSLNQPPEPYMRTVPNPQHRVLRETIRRAVSCHLQQFFSKVDKPASAIQKYSLPDDYIYNSWFK